VLGIEKQVATPKYVQIVGTDLSSPHVHARMSLIVIQIEKYKAFKYIVHADVGLSGCMLTVLKHASLTAPAPGGLPHQTDLVAGDHFTFEHFTFRGTLHPLCSLREASTSSSAKSI
jgi:hypothetical protein